MPRVKLFDEEKAIQQAMDLFWEKGYETTSLSDLTARLGIGKGSFYATFGSKEQLFHRCIDRYTEASLPFLDVALDADADIRTALEKLLQGYVEGLMNDPRRKGCFMANSCALVNTQAAGIDQIIQTHYQRIGQYLAESMAQRGVPAAKAQVVSGLIITFLIGASQQSKINRDKASYLRSVRAIVSLLGEDAPSSQA